MKTENKKKRILAIEDEPIINLITVRVMRVAGFEVDVADNGITAKAIVLNNTYHLYLCDIRTPAMNGLEFYQYLREMRPGHENRIIFTTGDTLNLEIKTFLSSKNNLFLAKPFTPEELRTVIKTAHKTGRK